MRGGEGGREDRPRLDAPDVERFAQCIAEGGVALFPADTVYGLACDPLQERAVARLYEIKGRPPSRPAAVMFFALNPALAALPELGPRTRAALRALLPGPLTALLPNPAARFPLACEPARALGLKALAAESERVATAADPGAMTVSVSGSAPGSQRAALGLRVPLLTGALAALAAFDRPVLQSSANLSGGLEARRVGDVASTVRDGVDLVLDGGELPGIASTVLDLRDYEQARRWAVVRPGPLDAAELALRLG